MYSKYSSIKLTKLSKVLYAASAVCENIHPFVISKDEMVGNSFLRVINEFR